MRLFLVYVPGFCYNFPEEVSGRYHAERTVRQLRQDPAFHAGRSI